MDNIKIELDPAIPMSHYKRIIADHFVDNVLASHVTSLGDDVNFIRPDKLVSSSDHNYVGATIKNDKGHLEGGYFVGVVSSPRVRFTIKGHDSEPLSLMVEVATAEYERQMKLKSNAALDDPFLFTIKKCIVVQNVVLGTKFDITDPECKFFFMFKFDTDKTGGAGAKKNEDFRMYRMIFGDGEIDECINTARAYGNSLLYDAENERFLSIRNPDGSIAKIVIPQSRKQKIDAEIQQDDEVFHYYIGKNRHNGQQQWIIHQQRRANYYSGYASDKKSKGFIHVDVTDELPSIFTKIALQKLKRSTNFKRFIGKEK